jgi:hypothetical protein
MKYSLNQVRTTLEVGHTSQWVVVFEAAGTKSPNIKNLNLIDGKYAPVIDINYTGLEVKTTEQVSSPYSTVLIPHYAKNTPSTLSLTIYDDHYKTIMNELRSWIKKTPWSKNRSINPTRMKEYALIIHIHHTDRYDNVISTDSYYVYPDQSIDFRGDQSFNPDTLPINFNVIGEL